MIRIAAVIPARLASTRFPGKPLIDIEGLPMIEHVRRRAALCEGFSDVVVATCDQEIASVVEKNGGRVVMTSQDHPAATDRVAEAATGLDCTHVVNVQGDEVLVLPEDLSRLVQAIQDHPEISAWNAVAAIGHQSMLDDESIVKCEVSGEGRILSCTRKTTGNSYEDSQASVRQLLGILAYRTDFLQKYGALERTPTELAERIDQCRIIEHGEHLQSVEFSKGYISINESREVSQVQACLKEDSAQQQVLVEVLR